MSEPVTFDDVVRSLLARVEALITEVGEDREVNVHDATDENGQRVAWGGTLRDLAATLREPTGWFWLCEAVDVGDLHLSDLEETPWIHVRPPRLVETIATAALRVNGEVWTLPRPARHHVLIQAWGAAHWKDGKAGRIPEHEQGFVTSKGRFVDRKEARCIAVAAKQVASLDGEILTSEDLW